MRSCPDTNIDHPLFLHPFLHKSLTRKQANNATLAVNNTGNNLILDKGSCEKLITQKVNNFSS